MSINLRPCLISYQSINQSITYSNIHIRIVCFIILAMHKVQIDNVCMIRKGLHASIDGYKRYSFTIWLKEYYNVVID